MRWEEQERPSEYDDRVWTSHYGALRLKVVEHGCEWFAWSVSAENLDLESSETFSSADEAMCDCETAMKHYFRRVLKRQSR